MTLGERLAAAGVGAFFGIVYGAFIALGIAWVGDGRFSGTVVLVSGAVFSALGFLLGAFIGDIIGSIAHFWVGVAEGLHGHGRVESARDTPNFLRALFALGVGTGIVLWFAT